MVVHMYSAIMVHRPYWVRQIELGWKRRPVVWLSGVRRSGKTTLSRTFSGAVYLNCDLPSVHRQLAEPESLYSSLDKGTIVVLDEVHRLEDPSRVLKIAADEYPYLRILATGSSTLAATRKFRDSLTGRKHSIHLRPVLWNECVTDFNIRDFDRRLLHGGLPEPLLSPGKDPGFFAEWMDSFYARDVQELFGIRDRGGFMKLLQLLMRQSGCLLDYTNLSQSSGLSRPTVKSHVDALSIAHAVFLLPPFHGGGRREIVRRPKCYAFDTGFITFVRGWDSIREDDRGILWEHLVLDYLRTGLDPGRLYFWRDKSDREVDFVIRRPREIVDVVECKINPDHLDIASLQSFRAIYPKGINYVVSPLVKMPYTREMKDLRISFCGFDGLVKLFT
jgi:predicted AAA+ superfamily ATPase